MGSVRQRDLYHGQFATPYLKNSQLDNAFSIYQTFCADQDHLRHQGFYPQKVAKALKSLCNIQRMSSCGHDASRRYVAEIEKVLSGWDSDGPAAGRSVKVAELFPGALDLARSGPS